MPLVKPRPSRSPYPYMIAGAVFLVVAIFAIANWQEDRRKYEYRGGPIGDLSRIDEPYYKPERQVAVETKPRTKYADRKWIRADSGVGKDKVYILGSKSVEITGTDNKISLMVLRFANNGIEAVALAFSKPPPTAAKRQIWVQFLAYSHPNLLSSTNRKILFTSSAAEGQADDGRSYIAPKYADIGWIIEKISSPYYDRFSMGFGGWYQKDNTPVVATINLEEATPALERMIREAR